MRIVGFIILFAAEVLRANTIFYNVDFNKDRLNEPPATNSGTNSPTALLGTATVAGSFGQLTNRTLVLSGGADVNFHLNRGTPDYTLDFDFQASNASLASFFYFDISFGPRFELNGNSQTMLCDDQYYPLAWNDGQRHHLHMVVSTGNSTNPPWTVQLDNNEPVTGVVSNGLGTITSVGDIPMVDLVLTAYGSNSQMAIDNIVIATTTNFVPLNPFLSFFGSRCGWAPQDRVVRDLTGNIYGTAFLGNAPSFPGGYGTVFKTDKKGNLLWVFGFNGLNGANPSGGLLIGSDGFLYGTTVGGGSGSSGTIFKMSQNGQLVWSVPFEGTNGQAPRFGVIEADDVNGRIELYGTTSSGGAQGNGTVFKLDASGKIQTLHSFTGGLDGAVPLCRLIFGDDGFLYGTTWNGGSGDGTVFKVSRNGDFRNIFVFDGTNGALPMAGLAKYGRNALYGTTQQGGTNSMGTIFRISNSGALTTLYSFGSPHEGAWPESELVLGHDGRFYGTTIANGIENIYYDNFGTIFRITPAGDFQKLADFHGGDGSYPVGAMIEGDPGKFYGTATETDGEVAEGGGTIFCLSAMRPILTINGLKRVQENLQIIGSAKCDPPVTNVLYRLNEGEWQQATTTNDWSNWTGAATLPPGTNTVQAYAVSAFGDTSRTNTLHFR